MTYLVTSKYGLNTVIWAYMQGLKHRLVSILRWSEKYTKTDMVYLTQGSFWMNSNTILISFFSFLLSISFARYVSKDTYGMYQFLISISSILGGLTLTGMNTSVTQAVARGFEGVFKKSITTQIKFGLISLTVGVLSSIYYFINGNTVLSISIAIISITLPLINSLNTWSAYLSGKKEFRSYFIFWQIVNFTYYTGLIATIFIFPTVTALILIGFTLNTLANFLTYILIVRKYKPNNNHEEEALAYGKKLSLSNILPTLALHIDNIIIFHFLGPIQLAIYAFASNIPERLSGLLKPISNVAFPKLATKNPEEVSSILPKKTFQLFIFSLFAGSIYVLVTPYIFKIFFPEYVSSIIYSQVYAIAIILSLTASLPTTSLHATRSKNIYILNIIHPVFSIGTVLFGTFYFGIWGTIISKIISSAFLLVSSMSLLKRNA